MDVTKVLNNIKEAYKARNMEELANKMGVSISTFNSWRNRKNIPKKYILECSRLTNYDYEWLLHDNNKYAKNTFISGDRNVYIGNDTKINGSGIIGSSISNSHIVGSIMPNQTKPEYAELYDLIKDYATPKIIQEFKERLLKIKAAHEGH
ncbi:helix-turn-helix domain-containing protein [Campylobacter sp. RM16191]|uniref:helix-turn-helix domain-containing protein n=1 Tax=Campylobacter sp. RM16191 TaxID=1705728 RepID=UPI001474BF43|nr:helix-turn-helix domain-containing protein [Campylobacter sp. RM16191]